jgi:hypothetical protein
LEEEEGEVEQDEEQEEGTRTRTRTRTIEEEQEKNKNKNKRSGDLKFIEAEESGLRHKASCKRWNWVVVIWASLSGCPPFVNPSVNIQHEIVEMSTTFLRNWCRFEEKIHKKGFPTT